MSPALANRVWAAKELAKRNRSVRNWTLLIGLCGGLFLTVSLFVLNVTNLPPRDTFVLGATGGAFAAAIFIKWRNRYVEEAKCPICQTSWEIAEGRNVHPQSVMTNWSNCPGCHVQMDDRTLIAAKEREE